MIDNIEAPGLGLLYEILMSVVGLLLVLAMAPNRATLGTMGKAHVQILGAGQEVSTLPLPGWKFGFDELIFCLKE